MPDERLPTLMKWTLQEDTGKGDLEELNEKEEREETESIRIWESEFQRTRYGNTGTSEDRPANVSNPVHMMCITVLLQNSLQNCFGPFKIVWMLPNVFRNPSLLS